MFKFKKLGLRNKIITIIILTSFIIGILTLFLIYPNIQNPLLKKQFAESKSSLENIEYNIQSSYNQNNYSIDKLINSKDYRILLIRIKDWKKSYIIADNYENSSLEGLDIIKNTSILGNTLTSLIKSSKYNAIDSKVLSVDRTKFIFSYIKFKSPDIYKDPLIIVQIKNIDYLYQSVDSIFLKMLFILSIFLIFILLLIILFIDYLLRPLKTLKYGISQINTGRLGYKIQIKTGDELEDIGDSFNSMSSTLYYDDIRKKEFIQNASHELKTPIAGIKTMAQFILMSGFNEDSKEFLKDIDHEVDRMNNIITDLLTLAELQNEFSQLNRSNIFTKNLIDDILINLKFLAGKKNITINSDIENFEISVDVLKFQRVLVNLIDNAIKYSNQDSCIYLDCKKISNEMIINIKDKGIGIPKESLTNIFQRFYRVDKARSRKTGGTGLGLAIVKEIVELHGGSITVESIENAGTIFTIRLGVCNYE